VQLGVQASSSASGPPVLSLRLSGRLGNGEINGARLRLPFQLTEVAFGSGEQSSPIWRNLFGDWLSPAAWNAALPPLEVPLELSEVVEIPAARFEVEGAMPMEISTEAYQARIDFSVTALMMLQGRAALGLRLAPAPSLAADAGTLSGKQNSHSAPPASASEREVQALEGEIARLSQELTSDGDLRIRVRRRVINSLLDQVAAARSTDLTLRLKPGRLRTEEVTGVIKVTNYTDVEGGDGRADVRHLVIERMAGDRLDLRLTAQGEFEARLRGREYGIPYRLSPHGTFAIKGEVAPLQVASEGDQAFLRAVPGSLLPIEIRLSLTIAGHEVSLSRVIAVPADRWLNRIALPALLRREWPVPRKIEAGNGGGLQVVGSQASRYTLSRLRIKANNDALDLTSDIAVGSN